MPPPIPPEVPTAKGSEGTYGTLSIQGASIKYIDTFSMGYPLWGHHPIALP